jgi:hypothetical protein
MEQYLQRERERFEEFARENQDGERDEALLDGDKPDLLENPIIEHDPEAFFTLSGFDIDHFRRLFDVIEAQITVPIRGRRPEIGAKDSFFLFLHWLRSANPINQIAAHFDLRSPKLYKHLHKLALAGQNLLVTNYIPICGSSLYVLLAPITGPTDFSSTPRSRSGDGRSRLSRKPGDTSPGNTGSIASPLRS